MLNFPVFVSKKSKARYEELKLTKSKQVIIDALEQGLKKHHVKALIELDVTLARAAIKEYRRKTGERLSFIAWITKCISQAVSEQKRIHALRRGSKLVVFDDVDIAILVEAQVHGESIPLQYIIRETNSKTFLDINNEMEAAKKKDVSIDHVVLGDAGISNLLEKYLLLPRFIRKLICRKTLSSPFTFKRLMGTVIIASVGMFGKFGGWALPINIHPLCFALGDIVKKPGIVNGEIVAREYLSVTIFFDHDAVDGAPAARFIARLTKLVEKAYGLEKYT